MCCGVIASTAVVGFAGQLLLSYVVRVVNKICVLRISVYMCGCVT